MKKNLTLIFVLMLALTAACGPAPTPAPLPTPSPLPPPSPTPQPTPTPSPTAAPTSIPQPGAEGLGDPYFPAYGNGGYDVQHYTLEISIDVKENTIDAVATIEALTTQNLSSFNLDLVGLTVASVEINSLSAEFTHTAGELTVTPASSIPPGTTMVVQVAYSGTPAEDPPPDAKDFEVGWHAYSDGIFVAGEPAGSATWYPLNEHPSDKATYTFKITVPKPYSVAANGLLQEEIDNGSTMTFIWESIDPIANYLVTIGVGELDLETQAGPDGLLIRNYFEKDIDTETRREFDLTPDMIAFFNQQFGPYPFEAYGVIVHDVDLGFALETQTLTVFGKGFIDEDTIAHELAHQWFGDCVTLATWQDIWLNEGFASFAANLWVAHAHGEQAALDEIRMHYREQATGIRIYPLSKEFILNYFSKRSPYSSQINQTDLKAAVTILFGGQFSSDEIDAILDGYTSKTISYSNFQKILDQFEYEKIHVPAPDWNYVLELVGLSRYQVPISELDLPGDPGPSFLFSRDVYNRGELTLHALRAKLGDEIFFEILRTYFSRFQNGNASTADFIAIAEEISGQSLYDFFDAWLYRQPVPDIPELDLFREDF